MDDKTVRRGYLPNPQSRRWYLSRCSIWLVVFAVVLPVGTAPAHHSVAATYFTDRTITIRGQVMEFMFRNPHAVLEVMGSSDDGKTYRWACEWRGTLELRRLGIDRDSLRPGDKLIVTGLPGRNPEDHRLLIKAIERPADGRKWSGESQ